MKDDVYTGRFDVSEGTPCDMFGPLLPKRKRQRGWTELDRIRARYSKLVKRAAEGDATGRELEEVSRLKETIIAREAEAREKWAKSFGK
jgi:hypothetical protein